MFKCSDDNSKAPMAPPGQIVVDHQYHNLGPFESAGSAILHNSRFLISGNDGNFSLSIVVDAETGSSELKGRNYDGVPEAEVNFLAGYEYYSSAMSYLPAPGRVEITEVDRINKTVSGRFFSTATSIYIVDVELASGSFTKIPYSEGLNEFMTCQIDGESFAAESIEVDLYDHELGESVEIQGMMDGKTIRITTEQHATYDDELQEPFRTCTLISDAHSYFAVTGHLAIKKYDPILKRIEGTFQFTGQNGNVDSKNVSDGNFSVSYFE
jgi:hypothetical protein